MEKVLKQHVFVSYSRKDTTVMEKIVEDLRKANIPVWFDKKGIKHDTSNYEKDIRKALDESFAFVLLASPHSRESNNVSGEIDIATNKDIPIYKVRVYNAEWSECLPMHMTKADVMDCQRENYDTGIEELRQTLIEKRNEKLPRLYEVSDNMAIPRCYLSITINSQMTLIVLPDCFQNMREFLNEIYVGYLADIYPPFTYGSAWVIASILSKAKGFRRFSVPLSWLTRSSAETPLIEHDPSWINDNPSDFGLNPTTHWQVIPSPSIGFALATNDTFLIKKIEALTSDTTKDQPHGTLIKYLPTASKIVDPDKNLLSEYELVAVLAEYNVFPDTNKYKGKVAILDEHYV